MFKLKANVTYKVPEWDYCNNQMLLRPSETDGTFCRFCFKKGGKACCSLYNELLDVVGGNAVKKHPMCIKVCQSKRKITTIEDIDIVSRVDPKAVAAAVLKEYRRVYQAFIRQGMTDSVAHNMAIRECKMQGDIL